MLGVAALLASSSMAAIELITLYARLDNAVHKMAPPPPPSPPISLSLRLLAARHRKDLSTALRELESEVSPLLFFYLSLYVQLTMTRCCSHAEPPVCE